MFRFYKDYGDKNFEPYKPIEIPFFDFFRYFILADMDLYSHLNFEKCKRLVFKVHDLELVDSRCIPVYLTIEFTYGDV